MNTCHSLTFLQFILINLSLQDPDQPVSSELAVLDPHYLHVFKSKDLESRDVYNDSPKLNIMIILILQEVPLWYYHYCGL